MLRLSSLALFGTLSFAGLRAQTSDLVVFSEMGEKFTLVVDGEEKNATPAARVEAKGIRNETPLVVVRFADAAIAPLKQNSWMEPGKMYTVKITTNKKGERVMRMQGITEQGSTVSTEAPAPTNFVDDTPGTQATTTGGAADGTHVETTTTVTETSGSTGENVNMNVGINGVGLNMNVNVNDGMGGTSTTTNTTTTTTTTTSSSSSHNNAKLTNNNSTAHTKPSTTAVKEPVYVAGYNGPIGCAYPMSDAEFSDASKSIESKGFEESKMTMAKQIGKDRCFTVSQVKGIMGLFGFEDSKLDFAKFAYDHVYDKGNYYKVNDAFSFESSIDELNKYIEGR
jgi:hypothetical protein